MKKRPFNTQYSTIPDYDSFVIHLPRNLSTDIDSYNFFARLSENCAGLSEEKIVMDFINNEWVDFNVCSILGAIVHQLVLNNNEVIFDNIIPEVRELLDNNSFFQVYMNEDPTDTRTYRSKIPCSHFLSEEADKFVSYIDEGLLSMTALPAMTPRLKKKINERLLEIFSNAHEHGKCGFLYASGDYFPKKEKISLTLCNIGKTIRTNVNQYLKSKLTGIKALQWAVVEGNTTREGNIPGGLGLSLIREFLSHNQGKIQIISSNGIWEEDKGINFAQPLKNKFQGTIVNLDININDAKSYSLASESAN